MQRKSPKPRSCDTFVVVPKNKQHPIIFGKNSDRPDDEGNWQLLDYSHPAARQFSNFSLSNLTFKNNLVVNFPAQHVVAYPAVSSCPEHSQLQCTYISVPQARTTHAVILSKPAWMWGAEMACNNAGLVIGNEAVWTNEPDDGPEALLGMDLVRLAAERCSTTAAAINLIGELLETHGQGGGCEEGGSWSYHNSFLIADRNEAWVMETAGKWWVAESVCDYGCDEEKEENSLFYFRNISNCLSIRTLDKTGRKYLHSTGLLEYAVHAGYWKNSQSQPFDWALSFSSSRPPASIKQKTPGREAAGHQLLHKLTQNNTEFTAEMMMEVLCDKQSGICMCGGGFRSNGSQVSVIQRSNSNTSSNNRDVHYFTGTPDPSISCFKPLLFPLETKTSAEEGEAAAEKNENDVSLEKINKIAAALWDHGRRRNHVKCIPKLQELERIGLQHKFYSSDDGAKVYLDLALKELAL